MAQVGVSFLVSLGAGLKGLSLRNPKKVAFVGPGNPRKLQENPGWRNFIPFGQNVVDWNPLCHVF